MEQSISITPFGDITGELLKNPESAEKVSPVGVVIYAGGEKAAIAGSNEVYEIKSLFTDASAIGDPSAIHGAENRIISLPQYDEIQMAQIPITSVGITVFRSISGDDVEVRFPFRPQDATTDERARIDQDEIIDLLLGKSGGIMLFKGGNLPEEAAILLERNLGKRKAGYLLFFHPDDASGFDSDQGLTVFFESLGEKLLETITDRKHIKQILDFDLANKPNSNPGTRALARAMLIARLIHSREYGEEQLRYFRDDFYSRKWLIGKRVINTRAAVGNILLTNDRPMGELAWECTSKSRTMKQLDMDEAKRLRDAFDLLATRDKVIIQSYINSLLDLSRNGGLKNLNDSLVLLNELAYSRLGRRDFTFRWDRNGIRLLEYDEYSSSDDTVQHGNVNNLARGIINEATRRRYDLLSAGRTK